MSGRNSLLDRRALFTTGAAAALLAATGASAGSRPGAGAVCGWRFRVPRERTLGSMAMGSSCRLRGRG